MDIFSHGLWGGIALGRKNKISYLGALFFGLAPDLFSFGIFSVLTWLGLERGVDWSTGVPPMSAIPNYVHLLYNITHSLIIFAVVFGLVWLIFRRPIYLLLAWPLHLVMDIFTHSAEFFPTPFLWPVSNYAFDGIAWSSPYIFYTNIGLLVILYTWFGIKKMMARKKI